MAVAALGLAAVGPARASTSDCVLSIVESSPVQVDPAGGTTFTVQANEGPDGTFSCFSAGFSIARISDTTISPGASSPSPASGFISVGTGQSVSVSMPFNGPGAGSAVYEVTCSTGCDISPSPPIQFRVDVNDYQLVFASPTPAGMATQTVNTNVTLGGQIQVNGGNYPTSGQVHYSVASGPAAGTFTPQDGSPGFGVANADGSGGVQIDFQAPIEGTYVIDAVAYSDILPPSPLLKGAVGRAKGAFPIFQQTYTVTIKLNRTVVANSGDGQSGQPGESVNISVQALNDGVPATDTINWVIQSGSGSLSQSSSVTTAGIASNTFNFGATPGPVVIRASRAEDPTGFVDLMLENYTYQLTLPTGPNASGTINSGIPQEVRIERVGNGTTLVPGATFNFSQVGGPGSGFFQPVGGGSPTTTAITDSNGVGRLEFVAPVAGNYTTQVDHTPPPTGSPVTGTPMAQSINLMPTALAPAVKTIQVLSGNNQSARPTEALSMPLVVQVFDDGSPPASPVTVNFTASPASAAQLSSSSVTTDVNGQATINVTIDSSATGIGSFTISATRADAPAATPADFSVNVLPATQTIAVLSGDNQSARPGNPLTMPLVVQVLDDGVSPANPVTVNFVATPASAAQLSSSSVTTDSSGQATINVTVTAAATGIGSFSISATRADVPAAPPATFNVGVLPATQTIAVVSGNGQSARPTETLTMPLVVRVLDDGSPTASPVPVNFSVSPASAAQLSSPSVSTDASGLASVNVTLTTASTGIGSFTINAVRADVPAAPPAVFNVFVLAASQSIVVVSGDGQSARPGQPLGASLVVKVLDDGSPPASPVNVSFAASPASAVQLSSSSALTDSAGQAMIDVSLTNSASGNVTISATRLDVPTAPPAVFTITTVQDVLALSKPSTGSGDGQTGAPGATLQPLKVVATANGTPQSGIGISWELTGPGQLSANSSSTDASGVAQVSVTLGPGAGTVNVIARRTDASSVTSSFVLTSVIPASNTFRLVNGNMQTGLVGSVADQDVVVELLSGAGAPLVGETIQWSGTAGGATPMTPTSLVDASGQARMKFRFGPQAGLNGLRATHAPSGLSVDTVHTGQASQVNTTTGNGSTGTPGGTATFGLQLAGTPGKGAAGIQVTWEVLTGGGSLASSTTLTDDQGKTSNTLTLGPVIGTQTVRASTQSGVSVLFSAEAVAATGQLTLVSGSGQQLTTNTPSAPLVVLLTDGLGQPLPNANIQFTTDNASVDPQVAVTDAQGRAQTIARVLLPGAATVTANTDAITADAVVFQLTGSVLNIPGTTPGDGTVGGALDQSCDTLAAIANRTPAQEDLYQRCLEFSNSAGDNTGDLNTALNQLPTPIGGGIGQSGQNSIGAQMTNIDSRFDMLRYAQSGGAKNSFNIGVWTPDGVISPSMLAGLGANSDDEDKEEVGTDFSRFGFFATGTIGRGEYDGTSRRAKFDYDIAGLTAGVDYRFSDSLIGGVALGYTNNDAELANNLGSLGTKGWSTSAYLSWFSERQWYVDSVLSYGRNDYALKRSLTYSIRSLDGGRTTVNQVASADTDGTQTAVSVAVGRDFQKGPWSINSYLRGNFARVEYNGYTERMIAGLPGQGLALQVDGRSQRSVSSALGARATYVLSRDWGILMPSGSIEWQREFEDDPSRVSARFAADPNGPTFVDIGEDIDNSYFNVGVGVSALFPGGKTAYLYYEELVGASRLRQGILSLGVRIEF